MSFHYWCFLHLWMFSEYLSVVIVHFYDYVKEDETGKFLSSVSLVEVLCFSAITSFSAAFSLICVSMVSLICVSKFFICHIIAINNAIGNNCLTDSCWFSWAFCSICLFISELCSHCIFIRHFLVVLFCLRIIFFYKILTWFYQHSFYRWFFFQWLYFKIIFCLLVACWLYTYSITLFNLKHQQRHWFSVLENDYGLTWSINML